MPQILEKELEDYIFKNHNEIKGLEGSFITRQLPLKGYGIIDLLVIEIEEFFGSKNIIFKILELKQEKIDFDAIGQICRYNTALKRNLEKIDYPLKEEGLNIQLFLIGNGINENNDVCYLTDLLKKNSITVINYDLDLKNGIKFENNNNDNWFNKKEKTNYTLKKFIKKTFTNSKVCQNTDQ